MSSDLSVTHGRASGLPGLRQQITIGSFTGPCPRGASSRGSALNPSLVSRGTQSTQLWLRAHRASRQMASRRHQGLLWPPLLHLTATKTLSSLTSCVPQQMQRRGPLLLFGREAQRQPRLDSRVWVDGGHPHFRSTSRQDPAPGRNSTPPCEGLRVFLPENVGRLFQAGGWKCCQQCHQGEAKTGHLLGTASLWVVPEGVQAL